MRGIVVLLWSRPAKAAWKLPQTPQSKPRGTAAVTWPHRPQRPLNPLPEPSPGQKRPQKVSPSARFPANTRDSTGSSPKSRQCAVGCPGPFIGIWEQSSGVKPWGREEEEAAPTAPTRRCAPSQRVGRIGGRNWDLGVGSGSGSFGAKSTNDR